MDGSGIPHLKRSPLASRHPVHVTARVRKLPSLRRRDCFTAVRRALVAGAGRPHFRVIEFSVQSNHIHLICEGKDREALARGLQGLFIRIARGLNRQLGRRGKVFADRYHDHVLKTPSEVRNALSYVLHNARHHAAEAGRKLGWRWLDRCSSARIFHGLEAASSLPLPHTWLLQVGWKRAGPISIDVVPGSRRSLRTRPRAASYFE